jgi:uracil-DNA glycosylase
MPSFSIQALLPSDWAELIQPELDSGCFERLEEKISLIYREHAEEVAPALENIFRAFKETSITQTDLIILGQDPYQTPGLAQGLSFSIPKEIKPGGRAFPSSLRNISKALILDGYPALPHGDLSAWASQGVLLLNATLTVQLNVAGSHAQMGWQELTDVVLYQVAKKKSLIWLLWGAHAQKKQALIEQASQESGTAQEILTASHPSGLSVYKTNEPFIYPGDQKSCGHFSKANELLVKRGLKPIEWSRLGT